MIANVRMEGEIMMDGQNIISPDIDVVTLRRNVGMVFQQPNPFPKSIFENIAYGLRINGLAASASERESRVEEALRQAAIWDEVKDRLHKNALSMSGGEQQRLCIARALAVRPEILLMDEPASALDPISTAKIEDLIFRLKKDYTIVIVTHNMQQAARVSDYTAFFLQGELVELGQTVQILPIRATSAPRTILPDALVRNYRMSPESSIPKGPLRILFRQKGPNNKLQHRSK